MMSFNHYYYFGLSLIFYIKHLQANQCHDCNVMSFNYSITADTLPSPNRDDCEIKSTNFSCFVVIAWYSDGTSRVLYSVDGTTLPEAVLTRTQRSVNASGAYMTRRVAGYSCMSSNSTPCNTVDKLKRSIISTSFPTDEQMEQFDILIAPALEFNSSLCFNYSNSTNYCLETDLVNCQQCMIAVDYAQQTDICTACPSWKSVDNSIDHQTRFYLNNRTEKHIVSIYCQVGNSCNAVENNEQVKQKLVTSFDYDKFFSSTASTSKLTVVILLTTLCISLFH